MTTNFNIPTEIRDFSVDLPSVDLRNIDFTVLDYETARRTIIEYVRTYYPNDFNDFVSSNGFMILIDILSAVTDSMSLRNDLLANEAFLPSAVSEESVENHLQLIGQRIRRQTAAYVQIEASINSPLLSEVRIPAGQLLSVTGPDGQQLNYEVFKGPGDWTSDIIIQPGKRGVVTWGVHGRFSNNFIGRSFGGPNQQYEIVDNGILQDPMFVSTDYDGVIEDWRVIHEPIQKYGPNDRVVEVQFYKDLSGNSLAKFKFGDNVTGKAPISNSTISIRYRVGGGTIGRIGTGVIDTRISVINNNRSTSINFKNISNSVGGTNKESIQEAKDRAPKTYSLHNNIVTGHDYAHYSNSFYHPYYGKISKSTAVLLTSENRNIVDIYVLSNEDGVPKAANNKLKEALKTSISSKNVMTDEVFIKDGLIKLVDLDCKITIDRNVDARTVKDNVDQSIKSFFGEENFDIGQPLYISNLISSIKSIGGVKHVNLITPNRNILQSNNIVSGEFLVAINELITLGKLRIDYYYDTIN